MVQLCCMAVPYYSMVQLCCMAVPYYSMVQPCFMTVPYYNVWFVVLYDCTLTYGSLCCMAGHYSMVSCVVWLCIIVWFVVLYGCTL